MGERPDLYGALIEGDRIDKETEAIPEIQDAIINLESTLLDENNKYSSEIPIIKDCLREAYGDYFQYIRFTNIVFYEIGDLIDANHKLQSISKEDNLDDFNKVKKDLENANSVLTTHFIEYGREVFDKLEASGKSFESATDEGARMQQKFLELVLERVEYVPDPVEEENEKDDPA